MGNCDSCDSMEKVPDMKGVIITAVISLMFTFIEIIIGSVVMTSLDNKGFGGWWGGLLLAMGALLVILRDNRAYLNAASALSCVGLFFAFSAAVMDSSFSGNVSSLVTCARVTSQGAVKLWGDTSYNDDSTPADRATICAIDYYNPDMCACSTESAQCILISLYDNDDCGYILTTLRSNLILSSVFCWFVFACNIAFVIVISIKLCATSVGTSSTANAQHYATPGAAAPAQAIVPLVIYAEPCPPVPIPPPPIAAPAYYDCGSEYVYSSQPQQNQQQNLVILEATLTKF